MKCFKSMLAATVILLSSSLSATIIHAQDAVRVTANGKVGIGTSEPQSKLDVRGTVAAQDVDADFVQLWPDNAIIAGRGGSQSSLRIGFSGDQNLSGGFEEKVRIHQDGNVGIGTENPVVRLHVSGQGDDDDGRLLIETTGGSHGPQLRLKHGAPNGREWLVFTTGSINGPAGPVGSFSIWDETARKPRLNINDSGFLGLGGLTNPTRPIEHFNGAFLSVGGTWTNASSRALKEHVTDLSLAEALEALDDLNPVTFNYISEPGESYVGFIAEDVPDLVARNDRASLSPMDIVALLTKVVQQQQKQIAELNSRLDALQ